jgi:membrane-bound lytic murein transglycosylase A
MELNPPDSIGPLDWNPEFSQALLQNTLYLIRQSTRNKPMRSISKEDLKGTVHLLQYWPELTPAKLYELFDFYEIQTQNRSEKVRLTGYYTPVIEVSRKRSSRYVVPFLRRPKQWSGAIPTSEEIQQGALSGKGLEIAWCNSLKTLRDAQLQGSCVIVYPDGDKKFLGFDGTNHTMHSTQDSMDLTSPLVNKAGKAYVFFQERDTLAWGAAGFPLTKGYSLAVDQQVIPLGACLLARVPIRDSTGRVQYKHRIVFAQDMGGSIKSTGHVDLYCGEGKEALEAIKKIQGYGQLWLMLPKR